MTNERTSLEKYTSHTLFAKGLMLVMCERWVGDGERLQHIVPSFLWLWQYFCLIQLGCSTGALRAQSLCLELVLTASNCNSNSNCPGTDFLPALNSNWPKPSVAPGYIIVWHPPASCGRLHRIKQCPQVKVIPDIFDRMHLLFTLVYLLIDSSAEGQYVTDILHGQTWLIKWNAVSSK